MVAEVVAEVVAVVVAVVAEVVVAVTAEVVVVGGEHVSASSEHDQQGWYGRWLSMEGEGG